MDPADEKAAAAKAKEAASQAAQQARDAASAAAKARGELAIRLAPPNAELFTTRSDGRAVLRGTGQKLRSGTLRSWFGCFVVCCLVGDVGFRFVFVGRVELYMSPQTITVE